MQWWRRWIGSGLLAALAVASVGHADPPPWWKRDPQLPPPPEARRAEERLRLPPWVLVAKYECTHDTDCAKKGNASKGEGFVCADFQCRPMCDDSDAGVTKLPLAPTDPQVAIPGAVQSYVFNPPLGGGTPKWESLAAVDSCKTPQFLQERICRLKPVKSGKQPMLDSIPIKCPAGTECQVGTVPETGQSAAFCGPLPPPPPSCDPTTDVCCKDNIDLGLDVCPSVPDCQLLASECEDQCPDLFGLQLEYPYIDANGQGLCHQPQPNVCTDPDPTQTYPYATVICVNGGPATGACGGQTHLDMCATATTVLHVICGPDGKYLTDLTDCPPGAVCQKGLCAGVPAPEPICTDTDATNDPHKYGWIHGKSAMSGQWFSEFDTCQGTSGVVEHGCAPLTQDGFTSPVVPCAAGEVCQKGVCVSQQPAACTETDLPGKKDDVHQSDSVSGTVNGQPFAKTDSCSGTLQVLETTCDNPDPALGYNTFLKFCPDGETCDPTLAICVPGPAPQCVCVSDTDQANSPLLAGQLDVTTTAPGAQVTVKLDACAGQNATQEYACATEPPCFAQPVVPCPIGMFCSDAVGVCVLCEEQSDTANDPFAAGVVHTQISGQDSYHADLCLYETTLRQYFCQDGKIEKTDSPCEFGCLSPAGVCKPNPCTTQTVDDGNACTIDACNAETGFVATHLPKQIDDGDLCTSETCDPLTGGIAITTPSIDDNDACTADSCNPATGQIAHAPLPIPSDGDLCTTDACDPLTGKTSYTPLIIDSYGNPCATNPPAADACPDGTTKLWLPLQPPLKSVLTLHTYNGTLYAGGNAAEGAAQVIRWNSTAKSWDVLGEGLGANETVSDLTTFNAQLYAATVEGHLYRLNGSEHWELLPTSAPLTQLEAYGTELFAAQRIGFGNLCPLDGANCSVFRMVTQPDGVVQWVNASAGLQIGAAVEEMQVFDGQLVIPISLDQTDQLFGYDSATAEWKPIGSAYPNLFSGMAGGVVVADGTSFVFAYPDGQPMLWKLAPGAALWEQLSSDETVFPQLFYSGALYGTSLGRVYRADFSKPGAVSWQPIGPALHLGDGRITLHALDGTLYAGLSQSSLVPGGQIRQYACVPHLVEGECDPAQFVVRSVSAGMDHTCARVDTPQVPGTVWCWGANYSGELGLPSGDVSRSNVPIQVPGIATATHLAAGDDLSCAALAGGVVRCWPQNNIAAGQDPAALPGDPYGNIASLWKDVQSLDTSGNHTCVVDELGKTWCWGKNDSAQVVTPASPGSAIPIQPTMPNVPVLAKAAAVTTGGDHTCALLAEDGRVTCWGANMVGQLGVPIPGDPYGTPTGEGQYIKTLTEMTAVDAGNSHTCATDKNGKLWCWGANWLGQLGTPAWTQSYRAWADWVPTVGTYFTSAGNYHTCALIGFGDVLCWGLNGSLQLGVKLNGWTAQAQSVGLIDMAAVSAGGHHTCVVEDGGKARCWGSNQHGQLGNELPYWQSFLPHDPYSPDGLIPPVQFCKDPYSP
ncbi:MAG: hypothetical protein HY696_06875 [Deltaproteobacteria bacterium]|nr:hypothetical protein [Deltaproteobacteria bacterium]